MKKVVISLLQIALFVSFSLLAEKANEEPKKSSQAEPANEAPKKEEEKKETPSAEESALSSVKKMIGFIRYKKNSKAIEYVDTRQFAKNLLKGNFDSLSSSDKDGFEEAIKEYIINKSFPVALKYFDKVDINYEKPVIKGNEAVIGSSVLYQGSEKVVFSWVLTETNGKFLVSDFITEGKRVSEVNRTKQIEPMYKKKGIKEVISTLKKISK